MKEMVLPSRSGVMVLPECSLFPHGGLPLYIFEERYRKMIREALEGHCVFCIGRPVSAENDKEVSDVGTAGIIRACRERDDGTYELLFHGVIRVKFKRWVDSEYPCAEIQPLASVPLSPAKDKAALATLRGAVEDIVSFLNPELKTAVMPLLELADEAGLLTDLLAQQLVAEPELRQKLLETVSVSERVSNLCAYLSQIKDPD